MPEATPGPIVHDAEYSVRFDQHGDSWVAEDHQLDAKLRELEYLNFELPWDGLDAD